MKKAINIFGLALVLISALFMQSCNDDDSAAPASYLDIYRQDVQVSELNFNLGSAFTMLGVHCDADWDASSDADWCTISNHAGYGYEDPDKDTKRQSYLKLSVSKNMGDARTAKITFTSGGKTTVLTVNQKGAAADEGDTFETAFEFVENIHFGYNLGNTLDADPEISRYFRPKSDLDYETSWGQPVTTQEIMDEITGQGFNVVRIPITWFPHMDKNWQCNEVWMNRVQEIVDMVLSKENTYCIINVQHDASTRGTRTDGAGWLRADMDEYPETSEKFKSLWLQIANRFKDYDQHLLFEAFNEILDKEDTWGDPKDKDAYKAITLLEQDFVNTVRSTGGNNEFRNLIVNTYSAGTSQEKLDNFQIPQDIHNNHLVASLHTYDPYNFCNDNGEYNVLVWSSECEAEIDALTARVNNRFNDLGMPYFYGEFGAIDENKDKGERIKYAKYIMNKFKQYETTGLWWMGLFDRKKLDWYDQEIVDALSQNCK